MQRAACRRNSEGLGAGRLRLEDAAIQLLGGLRRVHSVYSVCRLFRHFPSVCLSFSHSPKNSKNSKKSKTRHPFSRVLYRAGTVGRAARTRHTWPKRHPVGLSTQYMKVPSTTRRGEGWIEFFKNSHTPRRASGFFWLFCEPGTRVFSRVMY